MKYHLCSAYSYIVLSCKRKGRRSKPVDKTEQIAVIHSNTAGYTSKQDCWSDILEKENPNVVTINESALKGKRSVKQKNCFSYCENREKNMGGVATLARTSSLLSSFIYSISLVVALSLSFQRALFKSVFTVSSLSSESSGIPSMLSQDLK